MWGGKVVDHLGLVGVCIHRQFQVVVGPPYEVVCAGGRVGSEDSVQLNQGLPFCSPNNLGEKWCWEFREDPLGACGGLCHGIMHSCVGRNGRFIR